MNKEEKIKAIREACIKANPEIVDLKFGCLIKQKYSVKPYVQVISDKTESMQKGHWYVYTTHGATAEKVYLERYFTQDNYIIEILGRPIRLADVLLALAKISPNPELEIFSTQLDISKRGTDGRDNCLWNLLSDSLTSQSPETIEFIYQLVK